MARPRKDDDVRKYAVIGAQTRLMALRDEMQFILDRFPELTEVSPTTAKTRSPTAVAAGTVVKARHWEMSAEARKAVSARMKKYWAARRRAKVTAAKGVRQ